LQEQKNSVYAACIKASIDPVEAVVHEISNEWVGKEGRRKLCRRQVVCATVVGRPHCKVFYLPLSTAAVSRRPRRRLQLQLLSLPDNSPSEH
jgi:hypothetical protein